MRQKDRKSYERPSCAHGVVATEGGFCAVSYVVREDALQNGEVTIEKQETGTDFTDSPFEI